jgi:hypothetical protein
MKNKNIYNFRTGDMLYKIFDDTRSLTALVYKITPKYAYYAVCANRRDDPASKAWISMGRKGLKSVLYQAIRDGEVSISYAGGTNRRRLIKGLAT